MYTEEYMAPLFDFLENCKGVEQDPKWHPEGDVFKHSLQVLKNAFRETYDTDLILAAMLHDVGKVENSKGHEQIAAKWLHELCSPKTIWLIEQHMRFWEYIDGSMKKYGKVMYLSYHPWLPELVQLARWDKRGRNPSLVVKYDREDILTRLNECAEEHFMKAKHEAWLMSLNEGKYK